MHMATKRNGDISKSFFPVLVICTLIFVWPIPHTIALRNFLYVFLVFSLWPIRHDCYYFIIQNKSVRFWVYLVILTLWIIFQSIFISMEPMSALGNVYGKWIKPVFCFGLGFAFLIYCTKINIDLGKIALLVTIPLAALSFLQIIDVLLYWYQTGELTVGFTRITHSRDKSSFFNNMLLALLATESVMRFGNKKPFMPINSRYLIILLLMTSISSILIGTRLGNVGAIVTFVSGGSLILVALKKESKGLQLIFVMLIISILISGMAYFSYKSDSRWKTLFEHVQIGWKTNENLHWLNAEKYPPPKDINGNPVNHSNYARIAWLKEGIKIIKDRPLGFGYDTSAFGNALAYYYPDEKISLHRHAHSAIIDWAIAVGLPGLILLLVFFVDGIVQNIKQYIRNPTFSSLAVIFIASGFFFRMFVDQTLRDHMFEQFMFFYGFFISLSIWNKNNLSSNLILSKTEIVNN